MKFAYEYRTSDNVRHEGVIAASTREAAFAALKAQGIRPGSVREAPGFFNKLFGKGKRWIAIGVLGAALVGSIVYTSTVRPSTFDLRSDSPLLRHQIYGDPALMDELDRTDFATVFSHPGERVLARYAQPGRDVADRPVNAEDLRACLDLHIEIGPDESREVQELKRIVLWMKGELRTYLSDGVGTPERYAARLKIRQQREQQILLMAQNDLKKTDDEAQWERINGSLRSVGLPTVPRPANDEK